jgi:hypothetical protein
MDKGIKMADGYCGFELSRKSKTFLLSTHMLYTQVELGHPKLLSDKAHIKQSSLLQPQSFDPSSSIHQQTKRHHHHDHHTFDKAGSGAGRSGLVCWTGGKEDEAGGFLARARRGGHVFDVFATMRSRPQSRKAIGDGLEVKRFKANLSPHCTTLVRKVRSRADQVSAGEGVGWK